MSRSIPVFETQLGRQPSPLASVVLKSAANNIGAHFGQPEFVAENEFIHASQDLVDLRQACAHETKNLEELLVPTALAFLRMLQDDEYMSRKFVRKVNAYHFMSHDERALFELAEEHYVRRAKEEDAHAALSGATAPGTTVEGAALPQRTLCIPEDLVTGFLRDKGLESQAKAIEEGKYPNGFKITKVEYNFLKPQTPRSTWSTFSEKAKKVTFNCDESKQDLHLSTIFAKVLQDGFGDLKEKVKIILTPREIQCEDLCKFFWNNQLIHEFGARDAEEGIKLCRDAAAWHWIKLLLAKEKTRPSLNIADASTTPGTSGSASTAPWMAEPFPAEFKDVVQKLEKAGFQKEASDFAEKAQGPWYKRLQDKVQYNQSPRAQLVLGSSLRKSNKSKTASTDSCRPS